MPGDETTKPSLQLFYCLTHVSVVACVSSEMIRMGLFFNQTQCCFLIMIFSDLLLNFTRMLFLCFLRLIFSLREFLNSDITGSEGMASVKACESRC